MTEHEPRLHWHHHQYDDTGHAHHHRAAFTIRGVGRHWQGDPARDRSDVVFGAELLLLPHHGHGVGWRVKWGTNASETTPDFALHLGRLGSVWVQTAGLVPWRWLERTKPDGKVDYDSRVFGVVVDGEHFEVQVWDTKMMWSRAQPWWQHVYVRWDRLLFGKSDTKARLVQRGSAIVHMPEASYPATNEITEYTERWQRFRRPRTWMTTTISVEGGIPIPGKGENSWDCGDDAIYSSSSPGDNLRDAIEGYRTSVLRTRARYGGEHMSVPR